MTWQPWREAMTTALYGEDGFYRRRTGPAAHFRTSVHVSPLFAQAVLALATALAERLDQRQRLSIVDVGAGRGELLRQLAAVAPAELRLIGVDVVDRPPDLPERVEWCRGLGQLGRVKAGLLVANEWLDNIPVDVVEAGRLVEVRADGSERTVAEPSSRDSAWCRRWAAGVPRVEVGLTRDEAWVDALEHLECGLAVAIDYRLDLDRHPRGTLTGFRAGHEVPAVPDGSCDLTAHVLLESCAQAAGGESLIVDQRTALTALGISAQRPERALASRDPTEYLRALAAAGEAAELTDPYGLGGFGWLLQPRGLEMPTLSGDGRRLGWGR